MASASEPHPGRQCRSFSPSELELYDGVRDPRIYLAFAGRVFDVSRRRDLYGAELERRGAYVALAGRDATRALTKMSLSAEDVGRSDVEDLLSAPLAELHAKALRDWGRYLAERYEAVGTLKASQAGSSFPSPPLSRPPAARMLPTIVAAAPSPPRSPGPPRLLCMKPRLYRARGLLSPGECHELRRIALGTESMVFSAPKVREGLRVGDPRWTAAERELLYGVEARLGSLLGSAPHPDEVELVGTLTPGAAARAGHAGERCHLGLHVDTNGGREWRYATAICYLSTVRRGGATVFPLARPVEEEDAPPSFEDLDLLEASQRLLDAGVDHTDRVLDEAGGPPALTAQAGGSHGGDAAALRRDAEALVAVARNGRGVSVSAEEGDVAFFWTRRGDGSIDPHAWHGGEAVGEGGAKWTVQKFKEVPVEARHGLGDLAAFVARTRRQIMQ